MSHTRTRPDSAVETKKRKRRAIDPKKQKSYWDELLKDILPPGPPTPIPNLFDHQHTEFLAKELEKTPELVQRAKEVLTEILECGDEEEEERVQKLSKVVLGTWPLLASAVGKAFADLRGSVIGLVVDYANRDSATQRWARMKADPVLESLLAILKPPAAATTSVFDILRLFLSILIGYWGDGAELSKLDEAIGIGAAFGNAIHRKENPRPDSPVKSHVKVFSYEVDGADEAKDMERVRKWLETQYGNDKNVDMDDFFERIKNVLLEHVKIGEERGHFNGSRAMVDISVIDPWSFDAVFELVEGGLCF